MQPLLVIEQPEGFQLIGSHEFLKKSDGWTRTTAEQITKCLEAVRLDSLIQGYDKGYFDGARRAPRRF